MLRQQPHSSLTANSMFKYSNVQVTEKHLFLETLGQIFSHLGQNAKAFHYSEIVREIGNYYLVGMKRHSAPDNPIHIHYMCLELLERSLIIEPQSINPEININELLSTIPKLTHDKGIFNEVICEQRRDGYKTALDSVGTVKYVNTVLSEHIDDLSNHYPNDIAIILSNILSHIRSSPIYNHILTKYLDQQAQSSLNANFDTAIQQLRDRHQANHFDSQNNTYRHASS